MNQPLPVIVFFAPFWLMWKNKLAILILLFLVFLTVFVRVRFFKRKCNFKEVAINLILWSLVLFFVIVFSILTMNFGT